MTSPKLTDPRRAHQEVGHPALMEALIQAAEQVLAEHGPEGVTMIRIAARSGVSLDAIMQSLPHKDAIVAEAMERRRRASAQPVAAPASSVPRPQPPGAVPPVRWTPAPAAGAVPPVRRTPAPAPASGAVPPVRRAPAPAPAPGAVPPVRRTPAPAPAPGAVPPVRRTPAPAPAPAPPVRRAPAPAAPPVRQTPAPPPASALFRAPARPPAPAVSGTPATSRKVDAARVPASVRQPQPPAPPPPRETLEEALVTVVHQLVSALAGHLPSLASMPQRDRDAIHRGELKRMAEACKAVLDRHKVPDPPHVAHVMTLSCDRVIKDVMRNAPESFSDGRLERALHRLCLDFVHSE